MSKTKLILFLTEEQKKEVEEWEKTLTKEERIAVDLMVKRFHKMTELVRKLNDILAKYENKE